MSTTSKGMVQVSGATYRIVRVGHVHEVFRLSDDGFVGSFAFSPALMLVQCHIGTDLMRAVARQALRSSRLDWSPPAKRAPLFEWARWLLTKSQAARRVARWLRSPRPELSRRLA
jgi:hypothetical protein